MAFLGYAHLVGGVGSGGYCRTIGRIGSKYCTDLVESSLGYVAICVDRDNMTAILHRYRYKDHNTNICS